MGGPGGIWYCNLIAKNVAYLLGYNPAITPLSDYNTETIAKEGWTAEQTPVEGTAGYMFFYPGETPSGDPPHVQFYEYPEGSEFIYIYETSGAKDPIMKVVRPENLAEEGVGAHGSHYNSALFVPLAPVRDNFSSSKDFNYAELMFAENNNLNQTNPHQWDGRFSLNNNEIRNYHTGDARIKIGGLPLTSEYFIGFVLWNRGFDPVERRDIISTAEAKFNEKE